MAARYCPECGKPNVPGVNPLSPFDTPECREAAKFPDKSDPVTVGARVAARPAGHVTDLIRGLDRWSANRAAKAMDTGALRMAIAYLEEYRYLLECFNEAVVEVGLEKAGLADSGNLRGVSGKFAERLQVAGFHLLLVDRRGKPEHEIHGPVGMKLDGDVSFVKRELTRLTSSLRGDVRVIALVQEEVEDGGDKVQAGQGEVPGGRKGPRRARRP